MKWFYSQSGCWLLTDLQKTPLSFLSRSPLYVRTCSCDGKLSACQTLACPPPSHTKSSFWFNLSAPAIPWQPTNSFHIIYIFNSVPPSDLDLSFQYNTLKLFCSPFDRSATRIGKVLVQSWKLQGSRRIKTSVTQVLEGLKWRSRQIYCSPGVTSAFNTVCRVPPTGFQSTCSL